jgi:2-C-methyl-D-erythritol 4-phosphate cytidylyltransferase
MILAERLATGRPFASYARIPMDMPSARCFALVPCAGTGIRAGTPLPKQYTPIAGHAMVDWTLRALAAVPRIEATLVVLAPDDTWFDEQVAAQAGARAIGISRSGGATRAASVANGLQALLARGARADDWVLVHDAARCLLQPEWVDRLIDACIADPVGGLLAMPLADTLKSEADSRSIGTIERTGKWLAQTPQMFRIGMLSEALQHAGDAVTDEAGAIEAAGWQPRLVEGDARNLKVTWPQDFALAVALLAEAPAAAARAEITAFVPARDFELSRAFYQAIGFVEEWANGELCSLVCGDASIFLQRFYLPAHAENFMMHMMVNDLDAWWQRYVRQPDLAQTFGVRTEEPADRDWGLRDAVLFDPTGVLWRVAQRPAAA